MDSAGGSGSFQSTSSCGEEYDSNTTSHQGEGGGGGSGSSIVATADHHQTPFRTVAAASYPFFYNNNQNIINMSYPNQAATTTTTTTLTHLLSAANQQSLAHLQPSTSPPQSQPQPQPQPSLNTCFGFTDPLANFFDRSYNNHPLNPIDTTPPTTTSSHHDTYHHQNQNHSLIPTLLPTTTSTPYSTTNPLYGGGGSGSGNNLSTTTLQPPLPTSSPSSSSTTTYKSDHHQQQQQPNQHNKTVCNAPSSSTGARNPKKRTRASRRAPTTVLTTDTTNFRAMVQEFTGVPSPPFFGPTTASFLFPRSNSNSSRLDIFGSSSNPHLHPFLSTPFGAHSTTTSLPFNTNTPPSTTPTRLGPSSTTNSYNHHLLQVTAGASCSEFHLPSGGGSSGGSDLNNHLQQSNPGGDSSSNTPSGGLSTLPVLNPASSDRVNYPQTSFDQQRDRSNPMTTASTTICGGEERATNNSQVRINRIGFGNDHDVHIDRRLISSSTTTLHQTEQAMPVTDINSIVNTHHHHHHHGAGGQIGSNMSGNGGGGGINSMVEPWMCSSSD